MKGRYSIRKEGNGDYPWVVVLRMEGGYGIRAAYRTWADALDATSGKSYFVGYPIPRVYEGRWKRWFS